LAFCPQSKEDKDLNSVLYYLHRFLKHKGYLPFESWQGYKFRLLSFKELIGGGILPLFITAEFLLTPRSVESLVRVTGYSSSCITNMLTSLRYLGLLGREGRNYVLRGKREKIFELLNAGLECKKRRIQRIRKFLAAKKLLIQGLSIDEISRKLKIPRHIIWKWFWEDQPRLKLETAQLFLEQKLITKTEFLLWQRESILY
jgi:hypothetical protein